MQDFRSFMKTRKKFGDSEDFQKMRAAQREARTKAGIDGNYETTRSDFHEGPNGGTDEAMHDNRHAQQRIREQSQNPDLANDLSLTGNQEQAAQMQGGMRGLTALADGKEPKYEQVDLTPDVNVHEPTPEEIEGAKFMELMRSLYNDKGWAPRDQLLSKWGGDEASMNRVIDALMDSAQIYEPDVGFYRDI